jgi:hypothetical protein
MENEEGLLGIVVNLADYVVGADRGGELSMFDDFDIDYNQYKYLIETRVSGALTKIKSALILRDVGSKTAKLLPPPTKPARDGDEVTVPTVTNVVYKDGDGATLTTASPVTLTAGQTLKVKAEAASGYYFANDAQDEWSFTKRA